MSTAIAMVVLTGLVGECPLLKTPTTGGRYLPVFLHLRGRHSYRSFWITGQGSSAARYVGVGAGKYRANGELFQRSLVVAIPDAVLVEI